MRSIGVVLHRWLGLSIALFLFIAGSTGAIIAWDHEIDEYLNPIFFFNQSTGKPKHTIELIKIIEDSDSRVRVTYLPLQAEARHAMLAFVEAKINPLNNTPYPIEYNQVAIDPITGKIQATRFWGAPSLTRENILPFLYKLHYSLHLPEKNGIEWGILFMGIVALAWVLDCFIALWISFPSVKYWRKSFIFRWSQGYYKRYFDLHRSSGVWLWCLLLMLAVTSVSMNLKNEIVRPIVSWFSPLHATPFETRTISSIEHPIIPTIHLNSILYAAPIQAKKLAIEKGMGAFFLSTSFGLYGIGFFDPDNSHGDGSLGTSWLYYDSQNGQFVSAMIPGKGSNGDIFMHSLFPLHSGRLFGTIGRAMISFLGLSVALLSATGVYIWMKKHRAHTKMLKRSSYLGGISNG